MKALQKELQSLMDEGKALQAESKLDESQEERYAALPGLIEAKREELEKEAVFAASLKKSDEFLNKPDMRALAADLETRREGDPDERFDAAKKLATTCRGHTYFIQGASREEANLKAYSFAQFVLATGGYGPAMKWCSDHGIGVSFKAAQQEGTIEEGGALVTPEFENDMIVLREMFGIFRQQARMTPMGSDVISRPRRVDVLVVYYPEEGGEITESEANWDRVKLVARKFATLTKVSSELNEDAMVSMGDIIAGEIAYAFAKAEDDNGFNGDGTSDFAGITGARQVLKDVDGTIANIKGLTVADGNAYSEIILGDFQAVSGTLPVYAETSRTAWYCSKTFWETVFVRLALAAGGVTAAEIVAGLNRRFLGYPVILSQIMPKTTANDQVACLFGDLSLAADFGDRRQTTIAMSEHYAFNTDQITVRGTQRVDINVHDVGDTTDGGPLVGLIMKGS